MEDGDQSAVARIESSNRTLLPLGRLGGWVHVFVVAWLVALALAVLAPTLAHGASFGSYDLLSQYGLLRQPGVVLHNLQAGDQSDQLIPWSALAWTQVHHGQLPLWNPYSALGMPLAFSWQSGAFSVPALVGYLFPLRLSFTVEVLMTLVIAGTGAYVLGRVMRLGVLACIFAGTVFELSGPMLGWLGWPVAAMLSWSGWLFAAALLVVSGRHRLRYVSLLALTTAAMIYAGQAEILTIIGLALLVFLVALLVLRAPMFGGEGPIRRPVLDLVVAFAVGGALGAPLILPGLQIIKGSQRGAPGGDPAELIAGNPPLPLHNLIHLAFQGFDGLPIAGNHWFGYVEGYSETAAYVGVIALVLAVVGVGLRRRRPEVIAFAAVVVAAAAIAFVPPVVSILYRLPVVGTILWQRALLPLVFGLVVLAAVGMDALVHANNRRAVRYWAGGGFVITAVALLALWLLGRGHLPPAEASTRATSFIWPVVGATVGLVAVGLLAWAHRCPEKDGRHRSSHVGIGVGLLLLACETAFLLAAGAPLWTSASTPFAPTRAEVALKSAVGSSVVGFGAPLCFFPPGLGILPNAQLAYGIQELGLYDPLIPSAYFSSWSALTHQSAGNRRDFLYCPVVTTAAQARLYGVGFVLEPAGTKGPQGSEYDTTIGGEDLYRIPGAAVATLTPTTKGGSTPPVDANGTAVHVTHPNPASWRLVTNTATPQVLRLRLTDVPGWHASIDGRPVPLRRFAGVMLQVDVPSGHHTVELNYWPSTFTLGIAVAACAGAGLLASFAFAWVRGRRSPPKSG